MENVLDFTISVKTRFYYFS